MLQLLLVQDWQHSTLKKSEENNLRCVKMCSNDWDLVRMSKQAQVPLVFTRHKSSGNSTNISTSSWHKSTSSYLGLDHRHILAALKFSPKFWASLSVMFCFDALCLSKTRYFFLTARSLRDRTLKSGDFPHRMRKKVEIRSKIPPFPPLSTVNHRQNRYHTLKGNAFFVHTWSKTAAATDLPHKKRRN